MMKTNILQPVILSAVLGFLAGPIQASASDQGPVQKPDQQIVLSKADFSPRAYCRAGNGTVTNIDRSTIYLCCYKAKAKCVLSDTNKSISWIVPYDSNYLNVANY